MTRWISIALLLVLLPHAAANQSAQSEKNRCQTFEISPGEIGEGKLRYCDNGSEQELYVSGELDERPTDRNNETAADLHAVNKIVRQFKKRDKGIFRVVTRNAGGGETEWHQRLMMRVEDACRKDCRIVTEIEGRCESACIQFHLTCVRYARTVLHTGGAILDHATIDEDNPACNKRDPFVPGEGDLCPASVAVAEYKDRCGVLTKGRGLDIDEERTREVFAFANRMASSGVFDTTRLTCVLLSWAEVESTPSCEVKTR